MSHCSSICPVLYSKWTVGVAVTGVSEVLLLIAVSSVCLGVLVTRDPNIQKTTYSYAYVWGGGGGGPCACVCVRVCVCVQFYVCLCA